jgi:hypothetical protein
MLKNLAYYDRDATSAKFKAITRKLPALLLDVFGATREHWWINEGYQNIIDQKWPECL